MRVSEIQFNSSPLQQPESRLRVSLYNQDIYVHDVFILLDYAIALDANVRVGISSRVRRAQINQFLQEFGLGHSRDGDGDRSRLEHFLLDPDGHDIVDCSQRVGPSKPPAMLTKPPNNTLIRMLRAQLR